MPTTDLHGETIIKEAFDQNRTRFDYDDQQFAYQEVQRLLNLAPLDREPQGEISVPSCAPMATRMMIPDPDARGEGLPFAGHSAPRTERNDKSLAGP